MSKIPSDIVCLYCDAEGTEIIADTWNTNGEILICTRCGLAIDVSYRERYKSYYVLRGRMDYFKRQLITDSIFYKPNFAIVSEGETVLFADSNHVYQVTKVDGQPKLKLAKPRSQGLGKLRMVPLLKNRWSDVLKAVATYFPKGRWLQKSLLRGLGLDYLGFIDADLTDIFKSIHHAVAVHKGKRRLLELLIPHLCNQIDSTGFTTGLQVDEAAKNHPEIGLRIHKILTMRAKELDDAVAIRRGDKIDLSQYWLTAYGYEIFNAGDFGLTTDDNGLSKIEKVISNLGNSLNITDSDRFTSPVEVSNETKESIWTFAKMESKFKTSVRICERL